MDNYKKKKKIYGRPYIVDSKTVFSEVLQGTFFGWSWCKDKDGVQHTSIVFYIDKEARYTINWTPKNGSKRFSTLIWEIEGQLVFEDERLKDQTRMDYKEPIQELDLVVLLHGESDCAVDQFLDLFRNLCSFYFEKYENKDEKGNARFYDIASCNCRDHVESVFAQVLQGEQLAIVHAEIQILRNRLAERYLYRTANILGKFFTALGEVGKFFSVAEGSERFLEKMRAKASMSIFA